MSEYDWSRKSLDELRQVYWQEIEPALQQQGVDAERELPSHDALNEAGFSGLAYALREHHDLTVHEFLTDHVGVPGGGDVDGYRWGVDRRDVVDELESYLRTLDRRRGLADSTLATKRSRLARYARLYETVHGDASFLERVADRDRHGDEIERNLAVFDELDHDLDSADSKLRYLGDVEQFYDHLLRRRKAEFNPVANLEKEYDWERDDPDNPALSPRQVGALVDAVDGPEDELLVYGLCAWGLRPNEVASLHTSQIDVSGDDPTIAFDDRKNGPGTVSLLYGRGVLEDRLITLGERERWNGYLFPSRASSSGHVTTETIRRRFKRLSDHADVRVAGETPVPKMGRRFWYTAYARAVSDLVDQLGLAASDQGSTDAEVVRQNYLDDHEERRLRRERMREQLREAFENE